MKIAKNFPRNSVHGQTPGHTEAITLPPTWRIYVTINRQCQQIII